MNPKTKATLAKIGLSVAFSALIGYTMKFEKQLENKIDEKAEAETIEIHS